MKKLSTTSKILAVTAIVSTAIWIGSYLTRQLIIYQLFDGPDLILRDYVTENSIFGILTAILPVIVVHFISFIVSIVSILSFVISSKLKLKFNGWLFIIMVAAIVMMPFEFYLMLNDYKVITLIHSGSFKSDMIIMLLRERIKDLSSFSVVALITFISFAYFIVFKPFTKSDE